MPIHSITQLYHLRSPKIWRFLAGKQHDFSSWIFLQWIFQPAMFDDWKVHLPGLVNIQKTMENHHF